MCSDTAVVFRIVVVTGDDNSLSRRSYYNADVG